VSGRRAVVVDSTHGATVRKMLLYEIVLLNISQWFFPLNLTAKKGYINLLEYRGTELDTSLLAIRCLYLRKFSWRI